MKLIEPTEFQTLLLKQTAFIDVRAPNEFDLGSIPGATNLPLLTNQERHQIGLVYKTKGQSAAIELGHQLVSGPVKAERLKSWLEFLDRHENASVFCFRGGLRSQTVQTWLSLEGREVAIISGGYKALRQFCLQSLDNLVSRLDFQVVSGPTGSGKTAYLKSTGGRSIDLEALAGHRGSAFGALSVRQPTQVDFENALALELLRLSQESGPILIEDESRQIGHRLVPAALFAKMQSSPKIILRVPIEVRVEGILNDYVLKSPLGISGDVAQFSNFKDSVQAISRKLGGARTQEILQDLETSQNEFVLSHTLDSNRVWIRKLLEWYYDPYYEFSFSRRSLGSQS